MREWSARFATVGQPITLEDLILFFDCYYLPHEEGPEAVALYECVRGLLSGNHVQRNGPLAVFRQQAKRLREFCARITELRHRPLFYALSRRIWELREELEVLEQYLAGECGGQREPSLTFHLPGTYRGGMVAKLQRLLIQHSDGTFSASRSDELARPAGDSGQPTAS